MQRQRTAAGHRPWATAAPGRALPAGVAIGAAIGAAVLLAAATLLALSAQGSFEVARGSSAEPSAAVSGFEPNTGSRLARVVVGAEGLRVTVGPVVDEPARAVPDPTGEATAIRRVAVYLKVRNVGERSATFTPLDVALRDVDGQVYTAYSSEWSRSPALPGSALEPGAQVEGWRVFEVPAAGLEYFLLYRSDAMGSAVEARLPRLRSGAHEAALESLAQMSQEAQITGGDR